eukprot:3696495-Amphidinium_carterae.1
MSKTVYTNELPQRMMDGLNWSCTSSGPEAPHGCPSRTQAGATACNAANLDAASRYMAASRGLSESLLEIAEQRDLYATVAMEVHDKALNTRARRWVTGLLRIIATGTTMEEAGPWMGEASINQPAANVVYGPEAVKALEWLANNPLLYFCTSSVPGR